MKLVPELQAERVCTFKVFNDFFFHASNSGISRAKVLLQQLHYETNSILKGGSLISQPFRIWKSDIDGAIKESHLETKYQWQSKDK
jgi:hypothetical protein